MIGISITAKTNDLSMNICPPFECMFKILQDKDTGSLSNDESIPVLFKGTAGSLRFIIPGGERLHGTESTNSQRSDDRFRTPGNHGICISTLDNLEGLPYGMITSGTCRYHTAVRTSPALASLSIWRIRGSYASNGR